MNLIALNRLLNQVPVIVKEMHPVSLAYLDEPVRVYASLQELVWLLDTPQNVQLHRALSFDVNSPYASRFPVVTVEHDPFTSELNYILFEQYDFIAASMLTHDRVAERIVGESQKAETVILILLDGLSYNDCRDWPGVEPCLAASPTITHTCFPVIIGSPPLAARLFATGLTKRIGFTYWKRQEKLTNRLFRTIADTRKLDSNQPDAFKQVLDWLSFHDLPNTYIQIVYSALDDYAGGHRRIVPRQAIIEQIRHDLEAVADVLKHKGRPAVLFAVADHGILWKDGNHKFEFIKLSRARYATKEKGKAGRGRFFEIDGQSYWVLDYPQMGRRWKSNEQGIHGGISFEESIVPFIKWEVNLSC